MNCNCVTSFEQPVLCQSNVFFALAGFEMFLVVKKRFKIS